MVIDEKVLIEYQEEKMRKSESDDGKMRKSGKCANLLEVTLSCELVGYDIKTLNTATGKGSYMLKVGQRAIEVPYMSKMKSKTKKVTLIIYKMKGLRGLLRRAGENYLINLGRSPCCPNANYPHQEILDQHLEMGYHPQGSCKPVCMIKRVYGALDQRASIRLSFPFIVKVNEENIPSEVNSYIESHIDQIFGPNRCFVYHNGESTLKTETFNIINRATEQAVNNFMKHTASGTFPFRVVFAANAERGKDLIENIGFFLSSLKEINRENGLQIGADKTNGSGQVEVRVIDCKTNLTVPELEEYVTAERTSTQTIEFCGEKLENVKKDYALAPSLGQYAIESFNTHVDREK